MRNVAATWQYLLSCLQLSLSGWQPYTSSAKLHVTSGFFWFLDLHVDFLKNQINRFYKKSTCRSKNQKKPEVTWSLALLVYGFHPERLSCKQVQQSMLPREQILSCRGNISHLGMIKKILGCTRHDSISIKCCKWKWTASICNFSTSVQLMESIPDEQKSPWN